MSMDDIIQLIRDWPDCEQITRNDLKQPTSELVQKLYFRILIEMGLCESGLLANQADFETLSEIGEEMDLFKNMLPVLSLQSAIVNVLTQICGTTNFGLSDLTNPTPKRTVNFLGRLLNFYSFCNGEYEKVQEVQASIDACFKEKEEKIGMIEKLRNQNNIEASRACEEKNLLASTMEEKERLDGRMQELLKEQHFLIEIKDKLKRELEAACLQTQEIQQEVLHLEKEKEDLQGAIQGAAVIAKLDEDITRLNEEMESRRKKIIETKKWIDQLKSSDIVLKSILEVGKQYATEKSSKTNWTTKIQEINVGCFD